MHTSYFRLFPYVDKPYVSSSRPNVKTSVKYSLTCACLRLLVTNVPLSYSAKRNCFSALILCQISFSQPNTTSNLESCRDSAISFLIISALPFSGASMRLAKKKKTLRSFFPPLWLFFITCFHEELQHDQGKIKAIQILSPTY